MSKQNNHYWVSSPLCSEIVPILDYGEGPTEDFHYVALVEAPTKRAAIIAAVKHPDMSDWVEECRSNNVPPFKGLKAESAKCEHGVCHCEKCKGECPHCEAELESEVDA
jgi:hypothetical protein